MFNSLNPENYDGRIAHHWLNGILSNLLHVKEFSMLSIDVCSLNCLSWGSLPSSMGDSNCGKETSLCFFRSNCQWQFQPFFLLHTQTLNVWYSYLHVVHVDGELKVNIPVPWVFGISLPAGKSIMYSNRRPWTFPTYTCSQCALYSVSYNCKSTSISSGVAVTQCHLIKIYFLREVLRIRISWDEHQHFSPPDGSHRDPVEPWWTLEFWTCLGHLIHDYL